MSELNKYEAYTKKMQGICDENNLLFKFERNSYPITLTIKPLGGIDAQLSMLEDTEENGYTSPDAAIVFTFKDGVLSYKTSKTFSISDALFSKIKNIFKNMHYTWLQHFYRDVLERGLISQRLMPQAAENDTLPEGAEAFEEYEDEEIEEIDTPENEEVEETEDSAENAPEGEDAALVVEAIKIVRSTGKASVSALQRALNIGYAKASRLIDILEESGIVGPFNGSSPREVLPYDGAEEENANAAVDS